MTERKPYDYVDAINLGRLQYYRPGRERAWKRILRRIVREAVIAVGEFQHPKTPSNTAWHKKAANVISKRMVP